MYTGAMQEVFDQHLEQGLSEGLSKALVDFFGATRTGDHYRMMKFIHPVVFEIMPPEVFIKNLERQQREKPVVRPLEYHLMATPVFIMYAHHYYTLVPYELQMEVLVEDFDDENISFLKRIYKAFYGPEQVKYLAIERKFRIGVQNTLYALKAELSDDWKLLENKESMQGFVDQIIPQRVRNFFSN